MSMQRHTRMSLELRPGDEATTTLLYRDPQTGGMRSVVTPITVEKHIITVFNSAPTSDGAAAYWIWSMEAKRVHSALMEWLTTETTLAAYVSQAVRQELWDRLQDGLEATKRLDLQVNLSASITPLAS